MSIKVLKAGLLTTVQDAGRYGLQHLGVVPGGAMDTVALELANALVGNDPGAAALEITLLGPELLFAQETLAALCGAECKVTLYTSPLGSHPFALDRPVLIPAGSRLAVGRAQRGSRAYLAVAGGLRTEPALGSRSTFLPAAFGGFEGRALRAGDVVPLAPDVAQLSAKRFAKLARHATASAGVKTVRWSAPALTAPEREPVTLHAMEGRHYALFDAASQRAFFEATWRISPDSNRMGFRFGGGPALAPAKALEILSEPICLGTVQVPANGQPIALLADHQTTGGYPKIAEIAGADVLRLAQLAPGGTVRFGRCTLGEARELWQALRTRVDASRRAIAWEYR